MTEDAQYDGLAQLRDALSSDDPDYRAEAYGAVMGEDLKPSQVLETPPEDSVVSTLEDAGVVPENSTEQKMDTATWRQEALAVLQQIEENTAGSGGGS